VRRRPAALGTAARDGVNDGELRIKTDITELGGSLRLAEGGRRGGEGWYEFVEIREMGGMRGIRRCSQKHEKKRTGKET
jgi:hypothetical protein